jgi:hypothetical protein
MPKMPNVVVVVAEIQPEKQGLKMMGKEVRTVCDDAVKEVTRMMMA